MKIELELDYKTILRNSSRPVHLVAKLTAPEQPLTQRARPSAFTVVLDRSGSMDGAPIENAKRACREVIQNLRPEDHFSLVVFDSSAQVIIPLERPVNRFGWYQTIDELEGLQKITVQNLRLRIQAKLFCNAWNQYGDYPQVVLPDQRTEIALGDLVSGEERYLVLMLEVLPLPLLPDGSLPASLEGEELIGLEFAYTSITEEGTDLRLESRTSGGL